MEQKVSLVLSSGAARGLAHIGVIKQLEGMGFTISSIAGSSIGTLIGGLYAMDALDDFTQWLLALRRKDVFSLMDFTWSKSGMIKGDKILNKIKSFIPDMPIEDMPIPFSAVSSDLVNLREVVFREGSFYEAVRASIAIPAIFTPVQYMNTTLVDGGVLTPIPIKHVQRSPGDLLVVVNVNGYGDELFENAHPDHRHCAGYYAILQQTIWAMNNRITDLSVELDKPDVLITLPRNLSGAWDYHKAAYLIQTGRLAAAKALESDGGKRYGLRTNVC